MLPLLLSLALCTRGPVLGAGVPTIRVLSVPVEAAADLYYAADQGFFKEAGLDVQIEVLAAAQNMVAVVAANYYDIGTITTVALAAARAHGIAAHMIAPGPLHLTADSTAMLMVLQSSPLRGAKDLDGKTIALTGLANISSFSVQAWLKKNGADLSSIKFAEMPLPTMAAALQAGRVDAAMMDEPFITSAGSFARPFAKPYDVIAPRFLVAGWFSSDAWLQQHPDLAAKFVGAMRKAHEWAATHPEETAAILVDHTKLTAETVARMARVRFGTTLDTLSLQPILDAAYASGMLAKPESASDLIWNPTR
jgi:NitT/TauT family transport system substrate-binding protein